MILRHGRRRTCPTNGKLFFLTASLSGQTQLIQYMISFSVFPLCVPIPLQIKTWLVAPYKKPKGNLPENKEFNNQVSMIHIHSEQAIGFLKGHFPSLKGLHTNIVNEKSHKFATYWVASCIITHAFAMKCEAEEKDLDSEYDAMADFYC